VATLLYRLGRFAFRRRWTIALGWVLLLVLAVVGSASTDEEPVESFEIPGTESSEALDLLDERFPGMAADGATGRVVFAAPDGETLTDPSHEQVVQSVVREIGQLPGLAHVTDPFQSGAISQDGDVAYAEVTFEASVLNSEEQEALLEVAENGRDAGLTVEIGGAVAAPEMDDGEIGELIGIAIAALVLVITFGSFVAAGLPLLNAVVGVGVTLSLITIANRFFDLSGDASVLALMLGLALAIDYSLFIAFRYRHELTADRGLEEAAGRAVGTAGNAVVFAGLTVVIALAGLTVVGVTLRGELEAGAVVALALLLTRLYAPLTALASARVEVMSALVSFSRVFEVLDLEPLIADRPDAVRVPDGPVSVELDGVRFGYPAADRVSLASLEEVAKRGTRGGVEVLHGISFRAEPGQMVALVGSSGAGKSTIAQLVPRLYDVDGGAVRLSGMDVRDLAAESIREVVGMVTQDGHLFHDTIRANLLLADPEATEEERKEICEFYLANTRYVNNWDLVDSSAPYILGAAVLTFTNAYMMMHSATDPWFGLAAGGGTIVLGAMNVDNRTVRDGICMGWTCSVMVESNHLRTGISYALIGVGTANVLISGYRLLSGRADEPESAVQLGLTQVSSEAMQGEPVPAVQLRVRF
jgi:ABC-type Fe3+/spermidine/putrescine transport system ATPase subunit